ncbi:MAG: hypothetical protein AAFP86_17780 [Planctomycetota bacterium]
MARPGHGLGVRAIEDAGRPSAVERSFVEAPPEFDRRARRAVRAASLAVVPGSETDAEIAFALADETVERIERALTPDGPSVAWQVSVGRTVLTERGPRPVDGVLGLLVLDGSGDVLCRATGAQLRPLAFWLPIH